MCFAIRREVGFQTYQQDLKGLAGIPIELALPHKLEEYRTGRGNLGELTAFVKGAGIICPSVHAPQGRLTDDDFMTWARDIVLFAEVVGARSLVFHPEPCAKMNGAISSCWPCAASGNSSGRLRCASLLRPFEAQNGCSRRKMWESGASGWCSTRPTSLRKRACSLSSAITRGSLPST